MLEHVSWSLVGPIDLYQTAAHVLTRAEFSEIWKRAIEEAEEARDGRVYGRIVDAVARGVEKKERD